MFKKSTLIIAALLAASAGAHAAVGDKLIYQFNAESTGSGSVSPTEAFLTLTETSVGVHFTLAPVWALGGNFVQSLQFAYSGDAFTFVDGVGPGLSSAPTTKFGQIDSSYTTVNLVMMDFDSGSDKFSSGTTSWYLNATSGGPTITLEDFQIYALSNAHPSPAFGVISMPGAQPSNWTATGPGELIPAIPEPSTYALMAAGLGLVGFVARRRKPQA